MIFPLFLTEKFQHTAARRRLLCPLFLYGRKNGFQHTAARRRLLNDWINCLYLLKFQHTAARRRLQKERYLAINVQKFQHTAARRRLLLQSLILTGGSYVSTHSRTEAAARIFPIFRTIGAGFNTQPHGGGCIH